MYYCVYPPMTYVVVVGRWCRLAPKIIDESECVNEVNSELCEVMNRVYEDEMTQAMKQDLKLSTEKAFHIDLRLALRTSRPNSEIAANEAVEETTVRYQTKYEDQFAMMLESQETLNYTRSVKTIPESDLQFQLQEDEKADVALLKANCLDEKCRSELAVPREGSSTVYLETEIVKTIKKDEGDKLHRRVSATI